MVGARAIYRAQVEHDARRQLAQTLLRTGPLTVRGLAAEAERSMAFVGHHVKVLAAAGVLAPYGEGWSDDETAYTLRLDGLPEWAYECVLGEFSLPICWRVLAAIGKSEGLDVAGVAERAELSENDAVRYLLYLDAWGLVALARPTCEGRPARNPLRPFAGRARWGMRFRLSEDDDLEWPADGS